MATVNKDHARAIAKKLGATLDTSPKAHDLALVYHRGALIASFGIRRGSNRNLPHNHLSSDLHLNRHDTLQLAQCPLSQARWLEILVDQGILDEEGPDETQS